MWLTRARLKMRVKRMRAGAHDDACALHARARGEWPRMAIAAPGLCAHTTLGVRVLRAQTRPTGRARTCCPRQCFDDHRTKAIRSTLSTSRVLTSRDTRTPLPMVPTTGHRWPQVAACAPADARQAPEVTGSRASALRAPYASARRAPRDARDARLAPVGTPVATLPRRPIIDQS